MFYNVSTTLINHLTMDQETGKKDKSIGARIGTDLFEEIKPYLKELDISIGKLIRRALMEYMEAHPLEQIRKINQLNARKGTKV